MFIEFKISLKGNGVVSFGSSEGVPQEFLQPHENAKYAKVNVTSGPDGLVRRELFISPQCLKQALFLAPAGACLNILPEPQRVKLYATPTFLLKGWMNAKKGEDTYKRKSPFSIGQAVEVSGAVPTFNVGTNVGMRDENSLFYVENVGNTEYEAHATLNVGELSFLPLDPTLDRLSLPDYIYNNPLFAKRYEEAFGVAMGKRGLYVRKSDPTETGEVGIIIGNKEINQMAKMVYSSLRNLRIDKGTSFAAVSSVTAVIKESHSDDGVEWDGVSNLDVPEHYVRHDDSAAWDARKAAYDLVVQAKKDKDPEAKGGKKKGSRALAEAV